jgi:hypothetical protein
MRVEVQRLIDGMRNDLSLCPPDIRPEAKAIVDELQILHENRFGQFTRLVDLPADERETLQVLWTTSLDDEQKAELEARFFGPRDEATQNFGV